MTKIEFKRSLSGALRVYAFLVLEILSLRVLFHSFLEVKIGWSFTTDFGLFIPLTFAFFTYWMVLASKKKPQLGLQKKMLPIHILLVGSLILFTSWFQNSSGITNLIDRGLWFSLLFGVMTTAMVLFVPTQFYFKNENSWALVPCALIGILVPLYEHNYEVLWPVLGKWTGQTVCGLLPAFGMEGAVCKINQHSQLVINVFPFRAVLAPGCVGLEGQLLNSLSVLIFCLLGTDGFKPLKLIPYLFLGSFGIFWINIFRILVLMKLGYWSKTLPGFSIAYSWIPHLFHTHAAWILYGAYLGSLYRFLPLLWSKTVSTVDKIIPPQSDAVSN